jgi:leucyl aminopeptidase (aminopeptidase T)
VAVRDCLGVGEDERVLIVTNPPEDVATISDALYRQVEGAGGRPALLVQPVKGQLDLADPAVIAALRSGPDVVLSISTEKLGKDREALKRPIRGTRGRDRSRRRYDHVFEYLLSERRIRSFWSPGVTRDMFERTVPIDYAELQSRCAALASALTAAAEVRVTTPAGTDLVIGLRGRRCRRDDGNFTRPGAGGNIPCGEAFISPELGTSRGQLVFDGSISSDKGAIVIGTPIACEVEGGFVKDVSGASEARRLRATLERSQERAVRMGRHGEVHPTRAQQMARNAWGLGELGIGLNPAARIVGNMLEDEKAFRTCHVAIGANYDDDAPALTHLDGLMREPTIVAVGRTGRTRTLLQDGGLA